MVKKKIVLFNLWVDNNSGYFDAIIITTTFISIILLNILRGYFIFIPIGLISIVSLIGLYRAKYWTSKNIDLRDYFSVPEVGDILVVMNSEKFNFYLDCYTSSLFVGYEKDDEIRIEEVNVNDGNIKLSCKCVNSDHIYNIDWYKTREFVKSKSDIRADKLKELGI
jgi:hypothetical protein